MVGLFQRKIVRCPKCNTCDEWCKWLGQRQCCWKDRFTAGRESDTRYKQSQTALWDWLCGYYTRTPTYPAYNLQSVLSVVYYCPDKNINYVTESYVYWTVHHLASWVKRNQLDATYFIISFNAQHVSDVNTTIFRSLRLIRSYFMGCIRFGVCWRSVSVWL